MKKMPRRRLTDRIRELADRLWDKGDKEGATDMHEYARKKEAERTRKDKAT